MRDRHVILPGGSTAVGVVTLDAIPAPGVKGHRGSSEYVLPEAASSSSSLKDTLFLSMAVSDWLTWSGGGAELQEAIPGRK